MLLAVIIAALVLYLNKGTDYSGTWVNSGADFSNTLVLEKIDNSNKRYRFTIDSWKERYDPFADDTMRFLGGMNDSVFTIEIRNGYGMYSDKDRPDPENVLGFMGDRNRRCTVWFGFSDTGIAVTTEYCSLVYTGMGVSFDGLYIKDEGDDK